MKKIRFSIITDVHLFLRKDNKILLLLRENTGYEDGNYHVPAGHMDGNEKVTTALIREAKEEIGITILPENCKLVHVMHSKTNNERMGFFFEVKQWKGKVTNMEPNKCGALTWFDINELPGNMVMYARYAIERYKKMNYCLNMDGNT